jgi:hypothetical protein
MPRLESVDRLGGRVRKRREPGVQAGLPGDGVGRGEVSRGFVTEFPGREGRNPIRAVWSSRAADPLSTELILPSLWTIVKGRAESGFWLLVAGSVARPCRPATSLRAAHARRGERTPNQISANAHRITNVVIGASLPGHGPRLPATVRPDSGGPV